MLQFGEPISGARRRPGAYALIHEPARGLALVRAGGALHLPGGGIEAGEDPHQAAIREVSEETGLIVEPIASIGTALQAIGRLNKVSTYVWCRMLAEGGPHELDHELQWWPWERAATSLVLGADRWAIRTWATNRGYALPD